MEELKPCPFCGGKAKAWEWNGGARVDCENWDTRNESFHLIGVGGRTLEEAIEKWNGSMEYESHN